MSKSAFGEAIIKIAIFGSIICLSGLGFISFAKRLFVSDDLISHARATILLPDGSIKKALFSPDDDPKKVLLGLIHAEQQAITIAIFSLTDYDICKALISAAQRGVHVEIIADRGCASTEWSKIQKLFYAEIPVSIYPIDPTSKAIMHNKFAVFSLNLTNKPLLWTGSFNFTYSAANWNQENALVLDDLELIRSYLKQFAIIKTRSVPFQPEEKAFHHTSHHRRSSLAALCCA
jgi:phosphatidylserine/phosphatidylglycerophosphate/cardiolipin synthase-like enzyme